MKARITVVSTLPEAPHCKCHQPWQYGVVYDALRGKRENIMLGKDKIIVSFRVNFKYTCKEVSLNDAPILQLGILTKMTIRVDSRYHYKAGLIKIANDWPQIDFVVPGNYELKPLVIATQQLTELIAGKRICVPVKGDLIEVKIDLNRILLWHNHIVVCTNDRDDDPLHSEWISFNRLYITTDYDNEPLIPYCDEACPTLFEIQVAYELYHYYGLCDRIAEIMNYNSSNCVVVHVHGSWTPNNHRYCHERIRQVVVTFLAFNKFHNNAYLIVDMLDSIFLYL